MGAASVVMAWGEAETFWTLIEATIFLLVALASANKAGIAELRMGWGKDRIGLIVKGFPSVGSFLGLLGAQVGNLFLVGGGNRRGGDR